MALAVVWADHARAQTADSGAPPNYSGPPAPLPPALAARDAEGRITLRAVRVDTPLNIDGQIDEAAYQDLEPISDFIQMEPAGGQPATEKTEVWLFFDQRQRLRDDASLGEPAGSDDRQRDAARQQQHPAGRLHRVLAGYLLRSAQCLPVRSQPARRAHRRPEHQRAPVQRRLEPGLGSGGRPLSRAGGRWRRRSRSSRCAISPARAQIWGFNARRNNKWKNEISYLDPHSAGVRHRPRQTSRRPSIATVVGIDAPPGSKNLEIKPYAIAELTTDLVASPRDHQRSRRRRRRSTRSTASRRASPPTSRTTPTSRRSKPTSSRST